MFRLEGQRALGKSSKKRLEAVGIHARGSSKVLGYTSEAKTTAHLSRSAIRTVNYLHMFATFFSLLHKAERLKKRGHCRSLLYTPRAPRFDLPPSRCVRSRQDSKNGLTRRLHDVLAAVVYFRTLQLPMPEICETICVPAFVRHECCNDQPAGSSLHRHA